MPTRDEMVKVALAHAAAEGAADMEATMATLDDDGVAYELQPMGVVIEGRERARRIYEWFFAEFSPLVDGFELRSEWTDDNGVGQEYTLWVRTPDGTRERHDIIGILLFGTQKLRGERIYASERLIRMMYGPVVDEAVPLGSD